MRETFKVPSKEKQLPPRGRADHRAKVRFCPVCCGPLERLEAALRCTRCSNAFFILHTSSEKGREIPEPLVEVARDAQEEEQAQDP